MLRLVTLVLWHKLVVRQVVICAQHAGGQPRCQRALASTHPPGHANDSRTRNASGPLLNMRHGIHKRNESGRCHAKDLVKD